MGNAQAITNTKNPRWLPNKQFVNTYLTIPCIRCAFASICFGFQVFSLVHVSSSSIGAQKVVFVFSPFSQMCYQSQNWCLNHVSLKHLRNALPLKWGNGQNHHSASILHRVSQNHCSTWRPCRSSMQPGSSCRLPSRCRLVQTTTVLQVQGPSHVGSAASLQGCEILKPSNKK